MFPTELSPRQDPPSPCWGDWEAVSPPATPQKDLALCSSSEGSLRLLRKLRRAWGGNINHHGQTIPHCRALPPPQSVLGLCPARGGPALAGWSGFRPMRQDLCTPHPGLGCSTSIALSCRGFSPPQTLPQQQSQPLPETHPSSGQGWVRALAGGHYRLSPSGLRAQLPVFSPVSADTGWKGQPKPAGSIHSAWSQPCRDSKVPQ